MPLWCQCWSGVSCVQCFCALRVLAPPASVPYMSAGMASGLLVALSDASVWCGGLAGALTFVEYWIPISLGQGPFSHNCLSDCELERAWRRRDRLVFVPLFTPLLYAIVPLRCPLLIPPPSPSLAPPALPRRCPDTGSSSTAAPYQQVSNCNSLASAPRPQLPNSSSHTVSPPFQLLKSNFPTTE